MELKCKVQNYDWGKKGTQSQVATLHSNVNDDFAIDENLPYAELWIGTHVNGPSCCKHSGRLLSEILKEHPEYLGEKVLDRFGQQLPFLFKVLSVNKALSIQAHPAKKHAEKLHSQRPDIYKDPNHKPELAIALTPFEALCGFRPLSEIYSFLRNIPELNRIVGKEILSKYYNGNTDKPDLLKEAFRAVLTAPKDVIAKELQSMLQRFKTLDPQKRDAQLAGLIETLYSSYPDDVGCFVVYFLNYLKLKPSEAIYLGANMPHAYLYGAQKKAKTKSPKRRRHLMKKSKSSGTSFTHRLLYCIECMACSDNVVRAGLTPKLIDVETLCSMLIYEGTTPEENVFKPIIEDDYCRVYRPPVPDFAVAQIKVPVKARNYTLAKRPSASTLLVIEGKAKANRSDLIPGSVVFIPANTEFAIEEIQENLLAYLGLANV